MPVFQAPPWRLCERSPEHDARLRSRGAMPESVGSLTVSTMWQWWVSRSSDAVVILTSINTAEHSEKLRFNVCTMKIMHTSSNEVDSPRPRPTKRYYSP